MTDTVTTVGNGATVITVQPEQKKKIMILSASPTRDKIIDALIADELRRLGNDVWVFPCLREGRSKILEIQPDVCVMPPIRNPYSRDFSLQLKKWGIGTITRHTETSCSWQDWKKMDDRKKQVILGTMPYEVDMEIVWSQDEADILSRRGTPFPVKAVGCMCADVYKNPEAAKYFTKHELFCQKYGLELNKPIIMISSAWGFCDVAPDLQVDEVGVYNKEKEATTRHIEMIKFLFDNLKDKYNFIVKLHPGLKLETYKELPVEIIVLKDEPACDILYNSDILIHSGSTLAVEAHLLNKPALMFDNQNKFTGQSWCYEPDGAINKVSPEYKTKEKLLETIQIFYPCIPPDGVKPPSNANLDALKDLETGRFGNMDGSSCKRAAETINSVNGQFKMCWPDAPFNYDQPPFLIKDLWTIYKAILCGICGKMGYMYNQFDPKKMPFLCPHCGTKMTDKNE